VLTIFPRENISFSNATDHQGSSALHNSRSCWASRVLNSWTLGSVGGFSFPVCLSKPNHLFAQSIQWMRLLLRSIHGCSRLSLLVRNGGRRGLGGQPVLEPPRSNKKSKLARKWSNSAWKAPLTKVIYSGALGQIFVVSKITFESAVDLCFRSELLAPAIHCGLQKVRTRIEFGISDQQQD